MRHNLKIKFKTQTVSNHWQTHFMQKYIYSLPPLFLHISVLCCASAKPIFNVWAATSYFGHILVLSSIQRKNNICRMKVGDTPGWYKIVDSCWHRS